MMSSFYPNTYTLSIKFFAYTGYRYVKGMTSVTPIYLYYGYKYKN